jgi:hypothetical protein
MISVAKCSKKFYSVIYAASMPCADIPSASNKPGFTTTAAGKSHPRRGKCVTTTRQKLPPETGCAPESAERIRDKGIVMYS